MGERDDAKHQIEQTRARMTAVAQEVSRRLTTDYAKDRVREMAREEAMDMKGRALDHPWFAPLLGAAGWLVGRALVSRERERRTRSWWEERDRWYRDARPRFPNAFEPRDEGAAAASGAHTPNRERRATDEGSGGSGRAADMKERAGEAVSELRGRVEGKASEMKDRAIEAKDRLSDKVGEYRERISRRAEAIGDRMPDRAAIRSSAQEQPMLWALAAMAVGALFGFSLPVTASERQVLEPAREKLRDVGSQAMDEATSRMEGQGERPDDARAPHQSTSPLGPGESQPTDGTLH